MCAVKLRHDQVAPLGAAGASAAIWRIRRGEHDIPLTPPPNAFYTIIHYKFNILNNIVSVVKW